MNREELSREEFTFYKLDDFYEEIIKGIHKNSLILITGQPGTGKTTLVLQLINNLIENNPGLKHLVCSYEQGKPLMASHIDRLGVPFLDKFEFENTILPTEPHFILLDSVDNWAQKQASSAFPDIKVAKKLEALKKEHHAIFAIQHKNKAGKLSGAATFAQVNDVLIDLKRIKSGLIEVSVTKNRFGELTTTKLQLDKTGFQKYYTPFELMLQKATKMYNSYRGGDTK